MDLQVKKKNIAEKSSFHYEWKLPGFVWDSRKRLDSKRSRFTFLTRLSRRLEAIKAAQIKPKAKAPTTKYVAIKIVIIFARAPNCVCCSRYGSERTRRQALRNPCHYHTC
jgi:hypothetical protein